MILYYAPGACSLSNHIALIEMGVPHSLISVDRNKRTEDGRDFLTINPKGYVPALQIEDGTVLTENLAILVYLAEQSGKLLAKEGLARWRTLEALAFMTTELHGNFKPLFYPDTPEQHQHHSREMLGKRFVTIADQLGDNAFLVGNSLSIADTYLFVMLMWAKRLEINVPRLFDPYFAHLRGLPSITRALSEEGVA